MKSVIILLTAMVLVLFLPANLTSINDFRSRDYVEPHNITTASETTAAVTLSQSLFSSQTANVALVSNDTSDAPIPQTYVSSTKILTVIGLAPNITRQLTVTYKIDALTDYLGAGIFAKIWPALLL